LSASPCGGGRTIPSASLTGWVGFSRPPPYGGGAAKSDPIPTPPKGGANLPPEGGERRSPKAKFSEGKIFEL